MVDENLRERSLETDHTLPNDGHRRLPQHHEGDSMRETLRQGVRVADGKLADGATGRLTQLDEGMQGTRYWCQLVHGAPEVRVVLENHAQEKQAGAGHGNHLGGKVVDLCAQSWLHFQVSA